MNFLTILSIYLFSYYFFGTLFFLFIFGYEASWDILISSPLKEDLNGTIILLSSFLASLIVIALLKKRLLALPYPYLMLGFYIGNLSLLILFFLNGLLHQNIIWKFPEFLFAFSAPFLALILCYITGFVFWALIPSLLSAYILFKVMQLNNKSNS